VARLRPAWPIVCCKIPIRFHATKPWVRQDFYAIDAHSKSFEAFWRVTDAGSRVLSVTRSESACSFLTAKDWSHIEQWIYQLPLLTLRRRSSPPKPPDNVVRLDYCNAFSPEGVYVDQSAYCVQDPESKKITSLPTLKLRVFEGELEKLDLAIGNQKCGPLNPEILGKRVVSPVAEGDDIRVRVIDLQSKDVTTQLFLESANQVSTRLTEKTLTVADKLGRVIVIDLRRNCSIRNFRI
jgi:hypothetical protein